MLLKYYIVPRICARSYTSGDGSAPTTCVVSRSYPSCCFIVDVFRSKPRTGDRRVLVNGNILAHRSVLCTYITFTLHAVIKNNVSTMTRLPCILYSIDAAPRLTDKLLLFTSVLSRRITVHLCLRLRSSYWKITVVNGKFTRRPRPFYLICSDTRAYFVCVLWLWEIWDNRINGVYRFDIEVQNVKIQINYGTCVHRLIIVRIIYLMYCEILNLTSKHDL